MRKIVTKSRFLTGLATFLVAVGALVALSATNADGLTVVNRSKCTADEIIKCGVQSKQDLVNKYDQNHSDVKNIYDHYNITRADLAGNNVKMGVVHQDGRVVVDGEVVARNAYSVSRVKFHDQSKHVPISGTTLYEGPNMSIFVRPVDAFVFFRDGQFHRGVLVDCANPVVAKPEPKPVYSCDNLTATKLERTRFRFTTTAQARHGAEIVSYNYNFGDGNVQNNAPASVEHEYATTTTQTYTVTVTVNVRVNGKTEVVSGANCKTTVKVDEKPKVPSYKCDSLTARKIADRKYSFTTQASATNAEIVNYNYNFGDGNVQNNAPANVDHEYAQPGNYTATVTVNVRVDGNIVKTPVGNCKVTIKIDEPPKPKPVYKCESLTARKIEDRKYSFTTQASATNAQIVSYNYNFGDGNVQNNAPANVDHEYAQPGNYTATVTVNVRVDGNIVKTPVGNCKVKITIKKEEPKVPVYKCERLTAKKINRTQFEFTTTASATNAEIVSYNYNFGDGNVQNNAEATVEHTYAQPGNYTVTVTVNVRVDGKIVKTPVGNCKVKVTVKEEPKAPVYTCDDLTAQLIQNRDRTYVYTLAYTAESGATLNRVVYNFGDGTSETFAAADARNVEHTYAQPGNYTTIATLYFSVTTEGETVERSASCEVKIEVPKPQENCPLPGKEHLPPKHPECVPCPTNPDLPKDSPECKEDVETPPELPRTGLDTFIGGGIGLGSITAAGYYWAASRRNLLSTLLNK